MKVYTEDCEFDHFYRKFKNWLAEREERRLVERFNKIDERIGLLRQEIDTLEGELDGESVAYAWESGSASWYESGAYMEWSPEDYREQELHGLSHVLWQMRRSYSKQLEREAYGEYLAKERLERAQQQIANFNSTCPDGDEAELPF